MVSSIILSERPIEASAKIGYGNADLLLGFDLLGAGSAENLKRAHPVAHRGGGQHGRSAHRRRRPRRRAPGRTGRPSWI